MAYKNIIFDFDGTLLDTSILDNYYPILRQYPRYSKERQIAQKEVLNHIKECKLYPGFNSVFDYIKSNNIDSYIVTGGSKCRVLRFIKDFNVKGIFLPDRIIGRYELGMKNKLSKKFGNPKLFNLLLEKFNLDPKECIAFGNEIWDKFAANEANIKAFNCLWGATDTNKFVMKQLCPNTTIGNPIDIIQLIS